MRAAADVAAVNMEAANVAAEIVAAGWVWLWWWGQQPTGVAVGGVVVGLLGMCAAVQVHG